MGASRIVGTSTSSERSARLSGFGADLAVDPSQPGWVDQVRNATGGGANVVIDMVGGPGVNDCMHASAVLARIVNVGRLGGLHVNLDLDLHSLKRITYTGTTFRTRSIEEVREIVRAMKADLWPSITAGKLSLPIDRSFPLDAARDAHAHMAANGHFGKIILKP